MMPVSQAPSPAHCMICHSEEKFCRVAFFHMDSVSFELSGRSVGEAAALEKRSFVFVVDGVEYPCCRFQACFVSARVRRLLASDCCLSRLCLRVTDDEDHFKDVVRLMNGHRISITPANASFLEACARELENDELLSRILSFQLDGDISLSNVVDRIRIKSESHSDYTSELDFIASHFSEVGFDVLQSLRVGDLELVLANPLLKLESEDKLYDTIMLLVRENGDDYTVLLRCVEVTYLSESKVKEFLDRIFPDMVDASVWASFSECVCRFCGLHANKSLMDRTRSHANHVTSMKESPRVARRYNLAYEEFTTANGPFHGICRHLRDECAGNPDDKGVISISSQNDRPKWVVDYGSKQCWCSRNEPNSCVQFDFKSRRVCLSQYSIRSGGRYSLLSWAIEVSDDGSTWEAIDERNTQDLNGQYVVGTYDCLRRSDRFVRFVQLRQTGKNSLNDHHLCLSHIEFFGKITK